MLLLLPLFLLLGMITPLSLFGNPNSGNVIKYNAITYSDSANYSNQYYGSYMWDNGIDSEWLYSGDVSNVINIQGHNTAVMLNGGGSHPTLVYTLSNFPEKEPPNDTSISTISFWLYPNNTQDFNVDVSPQLFLVFNATDNHIWYLNFIGGGIWLDTDFQYEISEWLYLEWSFNNSSFNLTASYPPDLSTIPIVENAPLNPFYGLLPQPNYLDYLLFTSASIETGFFCIDTINFDWYFLVEGCDSSRIPAEAPWLENTYFWLENFTFQFDNSTCNFRNVHNLTINYAESQLSYTPIKIPALQQWEMENPNLSMPFLPLNIPANYSGNIGISNELYSLYISRNGSANLLLLYGTSLNMVNNLNVSMSGYFWEY
jgi:hypothetical protein